MELIWNDISLERVIGAATAQALVEGNVPLPEAKSVKSILDTQAEVRITSYEVGEGVVGVEASLRVAFICMGGDDRVFSFTSSAPFKHTISIDGAKAGQTAEITTVIQSVSGMPSGDFVVLTSTVELSCRLEDLSPMRVMAGLSGVSDVEVKTEQVKYMTRRAVGSGSCRIREEIGASGVNTVMASTGEASVREVHIEGANACVSGVLTVSALCMDSSDRLTQTVQHVTFEELIPVDTASAALSARASVDTVVMRPVGEEFGLITLEAILDISVFETVERAATVPTDSFSPMLAYDPLAARTRLMLRGESFSAKQSIRENIDVPEGMPEIYRTVYSSARPMTTSVSCGSGRVDIDGILFTHIIYQSEGGAMYSFTEDIPFFVQADAACDSMTEAEASLRCVCSASGGTGRSAEISYTLLIDGTTFSYRDIDIVTGIAECEQRESVKGIVVYYADKGETLYDIAKRFNATTHSLRMSNPSLADTMNGTERLVMML